MGSRFDVEVLTRWDEVRKIRPAWDALQEKGRVDHPFVALDWLECWYGAFCGPDDLRVVVVDDGSQVRSIFAAFRTSVVRRGIRLRTLSAAANGHSPRFCVLSAADDIEAVRAALSAPFSAHWEEKIDLLALPNLVEGSRTCAASMLPSRDVVRHIENSFASPALNLKEGWDAYYASRSRNFRHRFRQSRNNLQKLGSFEFEIVALSGGEEIVHRLRQVDARTWQHANGSGLFSTPENEAFYKSLLRTFAKGGTGCIGFLKSGGRDIAYELGVRYGKTAYLLKYGFDQEYAAFRPGVLVQHFLCEHLAGQGVEEVDLCGEATQEKAKWATHFRSHHNIWLLNQQSLVGKCTSWGLSLLDRKRCEADEAVAGRSG